MRDVIRNCAWGYRCDRQWADLIATDNDNIRFCGGCSREVHNTHSAEDLVKNIALNRCVNVSSLLLDTKNPASEADKEIVIREMGVVFSDFFDEDKE